jgi:hypothetical protein
MSRAFGLATGHSVMQFARGRRLTEAARSLARGAPDILAPEFERYSDAFDPATGTGGCEIWIPVER